MLRPSVFPRGRRGGTCHGRSHPTLYFLCLLVSAERDCLLVVILYPPIPPLLSISSSHTSLKRENGCRLVAAFYQLVHCWEASYMFGRTTHACSSGQV